MSVSVQKNHNRKNAGPQGHAIGIVDTTSQCVDVVKGLKAAGFSDSEVTLLSGEDGTCLLKDMMIGPLWSELTEDVLKDVVSELERGHFVFMVDVQDRDEAIAAAYTAARIGGHSIYQFGLLSCFRLM